MFVISHVPDNVLRDQTIEELSGYVDEAKKDDAKDAEQGGFAAGHFHSGVLFNFEKTLKQFRRGAELKHAESQFMVGVLCSNRAKAIHTACPEREEFIYEALENYQHAADQGHAEAAYALATVYADFFRDVLVGAKDREISQKRTVTSRGMRCSYPLRADVCSENSI